MKRDWDIVTSYIDNVGTTNKTVSFPKPQDSVRVTNKGNTNLIYTIGTKSGTLAPSGSITVNETVTSFTVRAATGKGEYEVRASEAGTEQEESIPTLPSDVAGKIAEIESSVAQKAAQTDLNLQTSRIDSLTTLQQGSTTGDAELIDARLGSDGKTYSNLGTSIRTQLTDISTKIGTIKTTLTSMNATANQVDGDMNGTVGSTITFGTQTYWKRTYLSVTAGEQYNVTTSLAANTRAYVMFTNEALTIIGTDFNGTGTETNGVTRTVKVPSGATRMYVLSYIYTLSGRIIKVDTEDLQSQIGINKDILRIGNLVVSGSNATISNQTSKGATITLGNGTTGQAKFDSPSTQINVGDFMFIRTKLKSDKDAIVHFITYGASGSMDYEYNYRLKAGVEYEIYIRTFNFTAAGSLKFIIQSDAANSSGQVITVSDLMLIKNSYEAWYDRDTKQTLKDFTKREIIVDCNGGGQFYDINQACIFAKRAFDVGNVPVTIKVKNGYYLQYPTNTFPYAPINKGANKISIIGESRDGVIIECYNTSTTQSKVIDIGGECTIENLTIKSLNDGTYNAGNDLVHNAYCIHNDTGLSIAPTKQYRTTVKNCLLYSECHSPVGAGLRDKQIQRYENCEFISNGFISLGALYVHASVETAATNMGVEIINCSAVSLDGTKAITLPDVAVEGAVKYIDVPVTIQNTIGYTTGVKVTDDNFKTTHKLQPFSALNNVADWNY